MFHQPTDSYSSPLARLSTISIIDDAIYFVYCIGQLAGEWLIGRLNRWPIGWLAHYTGWFVF